MEAFKHLCKQTLCLRYDQIMCVLVQRAEYLAVLRTADNSATAAAS